MLLLRSPHIPHDFIDVKELNGLWVVDRLRRLVLYGTIDRHFDPRRIRTLWRDDYPGVQAFDCATTGDDEIVIRFLFGSLMISVHGLRILHRFH